MKTAYSEQFYLICIPPEKFPYVSGVAASEWCFEFVFWSIWALKAQAFVMT